MHLCAIDFNDNQITVQVTHSQSERLSSNHALYYYEPYVVSIILVLAILF